MLECDTTVQTQALNMSLVFLMGNHPYFEVALLPYLKFLLFLNQRYNGRGDAKIRPNAKNGNFIPHSFQEVLF